MAKNLWKFEPREKPAAEPFRPPEPVENLPKPQSVGTTLRECREERGEDLRYVAQMLRIRYPYLRAIEEGLVDELPGRTYAIGFVRTYAEHLGLDAKELVVRFKAEVEGLNSRSDLNFPAPIPEGKIPSGAILLVGIIVAALIYAVWIYASSKGEAVSERALQTSSSAGSALDQTSGVVESVAVEGKRESKTKNAAGATDGKDGKTASEVVGETAEGPAPETPAAENKARVQVEGKEKTEIATAPGVEARKTEDGTKEKKANAGAPPPAPPARAKAPPGEQAVAAASEAGTARSGDRAVYGQENAGARIVLHAIADSWVEVRDKTTDELLLTRVLFKGESFRVPNRSGLSLLTGNAGGLRITVDGDEVSPIGSIGSVRRDVALEPDRLKSGKRRAKRPEQSATTDTPVPAGQ